MASESDSPLPMEIRSTVSGHDIYDATGLIIATVWREAGDTRSLQRAELMKSALEWSEELAECRMQEPAKGDDGPR